jgi:perosamine synthetase
MKFLAERHIASRPFFFPLSAIPAYEEHAEAHKAKEQNTVGYRLSPYGVNLPSGFNLDEAQVDYVCRSLKAIIAENGV